MFSIVPWIAAFFPSVTMRSVAPEAYTLDPEIAQHWRCKKAKSNEQILGR
jgi:hypothetical protein